MSRKPIPGWGVHTDSAGVRWKDFHCSVCGEVFTALVQALSLSLKIPAIHVCRK